MTEEEKEVEDTYREALDGATKEDADKYLQDQVEQGKIDQNTADTIQQEAQKQQGSGGIENEKDSTISGTVVMGDSKTEYDETSDDPINNPSAYKPTGTSEDAERLKEIGQIIIAVLKIAGIVVAVIMLIALGLKYMAGGTSERAEYKKSMIPFLIGTFVLIVGPQIVGMIYNLITQNIE